MKRKNYSAIIVVLAIIAISPVLLSWGQWGHERINRAAVLSLPEPLRSFFYDHIDYITYEASVPDLRKYALRDKAERPRHYIDIEKYGTIDSLPFDYNKAVKKYGQDFMNKNGIVFWYINIAYKKLVDAFKNKRKNLILFMAADLGHYIGDANMPFHTTVNHNGQLTGQRGIHALWESQLPEMFGDNWNFNVGQAQYIPDVQQEIYNFIKHSHSLVDTALLAYKMAVKEMNNENIYVLDENGKPKRNMFGATVYSKEFVEKFNKNLNGMVEKQLKISIKETANFWYTAWVNAGKPDLSNLDTPIEKKTAKKIMKIELKSFKQGKLIFVKSTNEF